jgi:hypothetical protein
MENAVPLFALASALFGLGFVVHVSIAGWLRLKRFERDSRPPLATQLRDAADLAARLSRIEQVVEATAIEVERLAEGQRYAARLLTEARAAAAPAPAAEPARVTTPY